MFSAAQVKSDARKRPVLRMDAEGALIEPDEVHEVRQAAKHCIEILKAADDWMTDTQLRAKAGITEEAMRYVFRNWDAVKGLIGDSIEIKEGLSDKYRYREPRIIETQPYNNNDMLNAPKSWSIK